MSCRDYADLLSLHAGGDLDREDDARVRQHVNGCTECARELENYRLSMSALKELDRGEDGPSLWPAVRAQLGLDRNVTAFRLPGWAVCAAALIVGLSVGLIVNEGLIEPSPAPTQAVAPEPALDPGRYESEPASTGGGFGGGRGARREGGDERAIERRFHLQRVLPPQAQDVRRISF